jgi:hypothetical protein
MQRAFDEDRDSPMFPFWGTLGLELLARATLAHVHPALLADPRDGNNILHAFGYGTVASPKSIPAKTVFIRCEHLIPEFSAAERDRALQLIELRNSELHSGTPAFEAQTTSAWLPEFFRLCKMLLTFQGLDLKDLFGEEEAAAAHAMIDAAENKVVGAVKQRIGDARKAFKKLTKGQQSDATSRAERRVHTRAFSWTFPYFVGCPACGASGLMQGKAITTSAPRMDDEGILVDTAVLPSSFDCLACGLTLGGYAELHAADLGGQYSVSRYFDPMEYFGEQGYFEEEYGND